MITLATTYSQPEARFDKKYPCLQLNPHNRRIGIYEGIRRHAANRANLETTTLLKQWYDENNPDVQFHTPTAREGAAPSISLRDCHGKTVNLVDTVLSANAHGEKTIHDAIERLLYIPKQSKK